MLGVVLESYETMRERLASDDLAAARGPAGKIALAFVDYPVESRLLPLLSSAARKAKAANDIAEMRLAFGEMSKLVIEILVEKPELQRGRYLFMCPMAKGYQKWVQTTPELRNPYFGKAMLECGEALHEWKS